MKTLTICLFALFGSFVLGNPSDLMGQAPVNSSMPASHTSVNLDDPHEASPTLSERNPRYQLRKSDTLELEFALAPEFNQTVSVQPDGYVTLKGAGSLHVEGQTVPELTATFDKAYTGILHNPMITVSLKDFEKPYFIAAGQVTKPGKYDLRSSITVAEGVAIAEGFNEKAKHSQVVLFHPLPSGGFEAKLLNVKKLLSSRNLSEDIYLQPGDMIYVPQNAYSKFERYIPTANLGAYYPY